MRDFKTKNVFLGPLKSPKNMLRKSILIGLLILALTTIEQLEDQNLFREGRKGNCPHMLFHSRLRPAREIGGGLSHGWLRPAQESMD